ncbi:hypothetical protein ACFWN7_16580 [Agromyces sp. NPDC058484]|uniref:hypothetical protein n=1 Tax=Agromyces sp. NPDC058484 TaxID=3346524 RepID=UPI00365C787B
MPLADVEDAVRSLVRQARIVAEGAGALSAAAIWSGRVTSGNVVGVVSGGNIDPGVLAGILQGTRLP